MEASINPEVSEERTIGLFGAINVGVGAIVGGGILALAGVAFSTTGPGAIVAFGLNGIIALLTALSFAEMSATFPESGGTYVFSKKVLSIQAAFTVGWIVWFASIVAAVLYALGFASFAVIIIQHLWQADHQGVLPSWLASRWLVTGLAIGATVFYAFGLVQQNAGGGQWANVGKVLVFGVLIISGLFLLIEHPSEEIRIKLDPFFSRGTLGLFQAMGYTFIALQGFDLIAAVAGEIRDPARVIPRAMVSSLGIALAIYLPLLFIISTIGMLPGQSIGMASAAQPEAVIAVAAQNYLGQFGYWLVIVAGILSMLSALQANLFAASRVARAMARDRTLPHILEILHRRRGTPVAAIIVTMLIVVLLLLVLPDVAGAGAAASLIFLITFALAHGINILVRKRSVAARQVTFKVPGFPVVPIVGVIACISLVVFQGVVVPSAGIIASVWLGIGGILYLSLFARRAGVVDAAAQALDPQLVRLRGQNPLVLVPIANPANAEAMVLVANALAPPGIGRVLLLSVVTLSEETMPSKGESQKLLDAQTVLRESLVVSLKVGLFPEALTTISSEQWSEIARVAQIHRCESLLLGLSDFTEKTTAIHLEELMSRVSCDVVVLRTPRQGWQLSDVQRILVPIGGEGGHGTLRARLLGSLWRTGEREITFLRILPERASEKVYDKTHRSLYRFAREEIPGQHQVKVVRSDNVADTVVQYAMEHDLVILGLQRMGRSHRVFGDTALHIARHTNYATILIGRRG